MRTNKLQFVGLIRKGNIILTTCVDANGNEFRFGKLVKRTATVTNIATKLEVKEVVNTVKVAVNSDVVVNTVTKEVVEVAPVAPVVDITPINKPSDRFDIDDYIAYHEYMIKHGGKPSVANYFQARAYYIDRA